MSVQIIQVPYDSGHRGIRLGKGPLRFVDQGIARMLRGRRHRVDVECLEVETDLMNPIKTAFEVNRLLAKQVKFALNPESSHWFWQGTAITASAPSPDSIKRIWVLFGSMRMVISIPPKPPTADIWTEWLLPWLQGTAGKDCSTPFPISSQLPGTTFYTLEDGL